MPKVRSPENKGLPSGWRYKHGGYSYRVPMGTESLWDNKKEFLLGRSLPEAYAEWAKRLEGQIKHDNINQLLDRYAQQVIPTKAPATQRNNAFELKSLRIAFGKMQIPLLRPQHIYQYVDKRGAKVSAKREIALLSHAYTKAVEWGYIDKHPFKGEVRLEGEKPRTRRVEDWEIDECMKLDPFRKSGSVLMMQAYTLLKPLIGLRRNDMLMIRVADLKEDGIHVTPHKTIDSTGVSLIIKWTAAVRAAIDLCLAARPVDIGPWLFCNELGKCYYNIKTGTAHGWESVWGRYLDRVIKETAVTERFTDSDLRAKAASDSKTLELAQHLLGHSSPNITKRVYRRGPQTVEPAK